MFILFSAFTATFAALVKVTLAAIGVGMAMFLFLVIALTFVWSLFLAAFESHRSQEKRWTPSD